MILSKSISVYRIKMSFVMLNKYVLFVFKNYVYVDCLFLFCFIGSRILIKFLLEKGFKLDVFSRR